MWTRCHLWLISSSKSTICESMGLLPRIAQSRFVEVVQIIALSKGTCRHCSDVRCVVSCSTSRTCLHAIYHHCGGRCSSGRCIHEWRKDTHYHSLQWKMQQPVCIMWDESHCNKKRAQTQCKVESYSFRRIVWPCAVIVVWDGLPSKELCLMAIAINSKIDRRWVTWR